MSSGALCKRWISVGGGVGVLRKLRLPFNKNSAVKTSSASVINQANVQSSREAEKHLRSRQHIYPNTVVTSSNGLQVKQVGKI